MFKVTISSLNVQQFVNSLLARLVERSKDFKHTIIDTVLEICTDREYNIIIESGDSDDLFRWFVTDVLLKVASLKGCCRSD